MPVIKHTHKYILREAGKDRKLYFCDLPDCSHFMPWIKGVINKKSICHQCGEEFILTGDIVIREIVKPRCMTCRGKIVEEVVDIFDGII